MKESITVGAHCSASVAMRNEHTEEVSLEGFYTVECRDADGNLKWVDTIENLVTNAGKIDALDKYLSGSAYTAAFYMGLVDGGSAPTYNAADTMGSHAGWTENQSYANATRPAVSFSAASATGGGAGSAGTGSKASSGVAFTINATATIAGVFLTTNNTKGGTTGTLYSAGSFSGGNRPVQNNDTLTCTYTAQA